MDFTIRSTYIFCLSNLSVPAVLSVCAKNQDFKIITDQPSIYTFFCKIYGEAAVIKINTPPVFSGIKRALGPFLLKQYKEELLQILGRPKGIEIYFFHNAFGEYVSWWIAQVSKDNTIYYKPDINISMWKIRYTVKSFFYQVYLFLCYFIYVLPAWNGERFFFKVSDRFLRRNNIHVLEHIAINNRYISDFVKSKLQLQKRKFLLLTGNTVAGQLVREDEFITKNDDLINHLGAENIAVKVHPRFDYLLSKEKECFIVPAYIPANIILADFDIFIGYTSSVLFEAVNAGKLAISLIDFFEPVSYIGKETHRKYLIENALNPGAILFPRDIAEIVNLIYQ